LKKILNLLGECALGGGGHGMRCCCTRHHHHYYFEVLLVASLISVAASTNLSELSLSFWTVFESLLKSDKSRYFLDLVQSYRHLNLVKQPSNTTYWKASKIIMSEIFCPYQIDFSVNNTSKTFGFSKKKVIFKFGIANKQAIADGQTGANCRGSEHEVIFTWSLNSGKRQILADGKDVHYSETGQNGWTADQVFQHHFTLRVPGISSPLRAHLITQPANRDMPQIKPFDLRINGCSYFKMSKIFQLGTPQMVSRPVNKSRNGSRATDEDAYMSPEERQAIAAAKLASLRDLNQAPGGGAPAPAPVAPEGDLINFLDDPTPAPPPPQPAQAAGGSGYFGAPPGQPGAPPPAAPYAQQPYSNYSLGDSFNAGPPPPQGPPPQQQSFGSAAYSSQSSFGSAPPPAAAPTPFGQAHYGAPPPTQQQSMQPQTSYGYQQQAPAHMMQQQHSQSSFGSMPPNLSQSFGSLPPFQPPQPSPSNQTQASYQTYGSAPTFAQPPPPQQQQQQQPPQPYHYGAPPQPQGYPGY
jgi:hypothetical protein